ncbi:putative membrane protein [Promicromonospora sp. AC04]|uniref:YhgE/Pip domain-containing protein n=1 Tax=Promicromonospora sp. AC04 TaxID=2135723 RepID=UPI000D331FAF|nr:YhgE/Pip domain-containing protein [Promicromonospora sp. AC04]PUB28648.1 putative membrane protein [Promicromonospora sp. AC04]
MTSATRWLRPEPFRNPWRAVAVALLPLMILGLLISALWNPQDRLDTVKAAIVNLDEPVEIDGQTVPLGRQLAAGLVSGGETADAEAGEAAAVPASDASYDWEISDASSAADGLADGTYAAVITIPEGFSAAATSFSGDDPEKAEQATIDVATAPDGRVLDDALAQIVAQTATGVLGSTLTETYVDNVLVGFSTLSEELGKAADGADQLADGATEAGKGAQELADGAYQTSDGVAGIGDGVTGLAGGVGQWASGADEWAAGADQVSTGVAGLASGASGLADGADQVAEGVGQSADGAAGLADGAGQLADGVSELSSGAAGLATGSSKLAAGATTAADGAQRLAGSAADASKGAVALFTEAAKVCANPALAIQVPDLCAAMAEHSDLPVDAGTVEYGLNAMSDKNSDKSLYGLAAGASELSAGADKLAGGADGLSSGAKKLSTGSRQLSSGLGQLEDGATQVASGASGLADGSAQLAGGASGLASGARELSGGAGGIASGATELAAGAGRLETGASQLATGVDGLADGVGELAGGATDLSDGLGQATKEIPTYTEQERQSLASVVADPVATDGDVTDLNTGTTGPMFAVLALWLGALAVMIVFSPVPLHARGSTRGALRLVLGTFAVPAAIGLVTGLATGAVLAGVEGLDAGGWAATMAFGALVSVAFVAVNQALAAALGHVGRGISLLVAVLVIATGVVSTVPTVLEGLAGFLPVGPSLVGLVRLIEPGTGGVGMAIAALALWSIAGLAITTITVARQRTVRVAELLRTA